MACSPQACLWMKKLNIEKIAPCLKFVYTLLLLMTGVACNHDPLTVTGKVVDESGHALDDVSVWACYSGWGWGEAGYLVWDKDYCSETSRTNQDGLYVITFNGPTSSRLKAQKDGWVQTQDFNAVHSDIVLTKSADYSSRLRTESMQREQQHRQRLPGEAETDYYCRVVLTKPKPVNLSYQNESVSITPALLRLDTPGAAVFAIRGSSRAVRDLSSEMVLKVNGETPGHILFKALEANCGQDAHLLTVSVPGLNAWPDSRFEILVPSISAIFDLKVWRQAN